MDPVKRDLSIFKRFGFEHQPVGVKYLFSKPKGIRQTGKTLAFCEMFIEAQKGEPFYAAKENHECVGTFPLGMVDVEPLFSSGLIGEKLGVFEDARAGRRPYDVLPKLGRNTVNYVAFSSLDKLSFDPDVLIVTAPLEQAEILMRASSYRNGKKWTATTTNVLGCSWLYIYPYISGELNYIIYGLCCDGMLAKKMLPYGMILVSIPFDQLPAIVDNLEHMEWVPKVYSMTRDESSAFFDKLVQEAMGT